MILSFFYELSTLSFWIDHQGAWFVAMLIPVYFVFPWLFDWVEGDCQNQRTRQIKIAIPTAVITVIAFTISIRNPKLYNHLSQVFISIIFYLLGFYAADEVIREQCKGYLLSFLCIFLYAIKAITPLGDFCFISSVSWSLLAIPILTVSVFFLRKIKSRVIDSTLGFLGKYSLEMYLWNIFLIQAIKEFGIIDRLAEYGDSSGYFAYGSVVVGGIFLSVVYGRIEEIVVHKMNMKNSLRTLRS